MPHTLLSQWLLFLDIDEFLFCGGKWCGGTTAASPCNDWVPKFLPKVSACRVYVVCLCVRAGRGSAFRTKASRHSLANRTRSGQAFGNTMDLRVPWFFASTQEKTRKPGFVMERSGRTADWVQWGHGD